MITIFLKEEDGAFSLSVSGHAGAGKEGHDLICAAVSMLTVALGHRIVEMKADGRIAGKPSVKLAFGSAEIRCTPCAEWADIVKEDFIFCDAGFKKLQEDFPQFVKVKSSLSG